MTEAMNGRHRLENFGAKAAQAPDVDLLLQYACQEIAEALGVSQVKGLEYVPDRRPF